MQKQHPSQLANLLKEVAISYRNETFIPDLLPHLQGENLEDEVIEMILQPFVEAAIATKDLFYSSVQKLKTGLDAFVPRAMELLWMNPTLHNADDSGKVNEQNADALIVVFVAYICSSHPVGLHVGDFKLKPTRPHATEEPSVV